MIFPLLISITITRTPKMRDSRKHISFYFFFISINIYIYTPQKHLGSTIRYYSTLTLDGQGIPMSSHSKYLSSIIQKDEEINSDVQP